MVRRRNGSPLGDSLPGAFVARSAGQSVQDHGTRASCIHREHREQTPCKRTTERGRIGARAEVPVSLLLRRRGANPQRGLG